MAALLIAAVMTMSLAGCGGKGGGSADAGDRTVVYYASSYVTAQVRDAYLELVELPNGSNPQVLYYNKGILEECGINKSISTKVSKQKQLY